MTSRKRYEQLNNQNNGKRFGKDPVMSGDPGLLLRLLALCIVTMSLSACGANTSMHADTTTSLNSSNGSPAGVIRSDGLMANGLLPASPYY